MFYLPFKRVKKWAWESYWLVYAVVACWSCPGPWPWEPRPTRLWCSATLLAKLLGYCFLCGAMWGVGGLTWGLMIRYLGVGLGLAIGCGLCSAAGTRHPADHCRRGL